MRRRHKSNGATALRWDGPRTGRDPPPPAEGGASGPFLTGSASSPVQAREALQEAGSARPAEALRLSPLLLQLVL